jgi:hypothetical protein
MQGFGPWQLFWQFLPMIFCPWLVSSKRFCNLWYKRPEMKENKLGFRTKLSRSPLKICSNDSVYLICVFATI